MSRREGVNLFALIVSAFVFLLIILCLIGIVWVGVAR